MSKMDGLRAMREARYEAAAKAVKPAAKPPKAATKTTGSAKPVVPAASTDAVCGHRAISGRTCTREAGHAAKSHRYA